MPIFDNYKSIFIHIPKCAGTSITKSLGNHRFKNRPIGYNNFSLQLMYGRNLEHSTYKKIRLVHPIKFRSYFKFAFVRNPFDRMYSEYKWRTKWDSSIASKTFEDMLLNIPKYRRNREPHFMEQAEFIFSKNNNLMIDFVGRFETIVQDFQIVTEKIGASTSNLEVLNKSNTDCSSYRPEYTKRSVDIVSSYFKRDIELLGYEF